MKTVKLSAFAGIRNDVSPERFNVQDGEVRTDLLNAINIELDESGKPIRRLGATALDATSSHSLWANDELAYVVRAGTLHQINSDMTVTDLGIPILGNRVCYQRIANDVFFTDALITGVVGTNGYRPWGIIPPPRAALSTITGSLRAGTYLISTTFKRSTGLESGASPIQAVTVSANQGVQVPIPISNDPLVTEVCVYMSDCNGEVAYLVGTFSTNEAACLITQLPAERTIRVRTLRCGPPMAGQVLGHYRGVLYIAAGNYLYYTNPYEYELVNRLINFIPFTAPVKTFSTVTDGIFIGTEDEIVFLQGNSPDQFVRVPKANYGSVLGTELYIPAHFFSNGEGGVPVPLWMSTKGQCVGFDGGQFKNLTGGRYILPDGVATGASLLKVRGESPQLVTTLFG